MIRRILESTVGFAVIAGMAFGLTILTPAALPRTTTVEATRSVKVVCMPAAAQATILVDRADKIGPLGGQMSETAQTVLTGQETSVVAEGMEGPVGGALTGSGTVKTLTPCLRPVSQGVIALPATADTQLRIVNPDSSEAAIDLTLYGAEGEIQSLGARGIALAPFEERTIALSVLTAEATPVGVSFKASRGRAAVAAFTQTSARATAAIPSQLAEQHYLPGVPAGASQAVVVLANPSERRLTVNLKAYGSTPAYTPEGGENISVAPYSSVSVPLQDSLASEATSIGVLADAPVIAGLSYTVNDSDDVAPVQAGDDLTTFTAPGGVLQLTNPGGEAVTATVTAVGAGGAEESSSVEVGAGKTVAHPLPAGAEGGQRVRVSADTPLFGAVVSAGQQGAWTAPLEVVASGAVKPVAAELDPSLR